MAITGTKLFGTGDVLTSADVNQYLMRGVKVFADAATRDAAYGGSGEPVLEEGEVCYLADTNALQTYDGAAWNSFTIPVFKSYGYNAVTTSQTTSSASYTDLTTSGPTVTITTGTSAVVIVSANMESGNATWASSMSFTVSGATTISASDNRKVDVFGDPTTHGVQRSASRVIVLDGTLTAGSNTFTAKYRATSTVTATFSNRELLVLPL